MLQGVPAGQITTVSFGEERPEAMGKLRKRLCAESPGTLRPHELMTMKLRHIGLVGLLAPLSACNLMAPAEDDPVLVKLNELEQRLATIERVVRNESLVDLTQEVNALQRRNDETNGRLEELLHDSTQTAERQRDLYADLDQRLQNLESAVASRGSTNVLDGGTLTPGELPVPGGSDRANYQARLRAPEERALRAGGAGVRAIPGRLPGQRAGRQRPVLAGPSRTT